MQGASTPPLLFCHQIWRTRNNALHSYLKTPDSQKNTTNSKGAGHRKENEPPPPGSPQQIVVRTTHGFFKYNPRSPASRSPPPLHMSPGYVAPSATAKNSISCVAACTKNAEDRAKAGSATAPRKPVEILRVKRIGSEELRHANGHRRHQTITQSSSSWLRQLQ